LGANSSDGALNDEPHDDFLQQLEDELEDDSSCGPEISEGLAKIINRRFSNRLEFKVLKEKLEL